jgi:hypothetical protein
VDAMEAKSVKRLISVTGLGAGDSRGHGGLLYDAATMLRSLPARLLCAGAAFSQLCDLANRHQVAQKRMPEKGLQIKNLLPAHFVKPMLSCCKLKHLIRMAQKRSAHDSV